MTLDMDSFVFGTLIFFFPMAHLVPSKSCKASPSFTRTCASRMAHRFRQTSIIFRQVEILLAHRRSKWTNSEASNSNISIYYAFNVHLLTKSWQPYACLNSQNYHPPHDTPSFMAFPTYKLGCDRHYILMVSMTNSTSCQSTLSSTSPWHTADLIDFLFRSFSYAFGFFRTPSLVWQTKYLNCVRAIASFIVNTISFGDNTMLKVGNCHWHTHTHIDSKTAAFHPNEKSNQFCSTCPVSLS